MAEDWYRHQLLVHVDLVPPADVVDVVYSYPFAGAHSLPEIRACVPIADVDEAAARALFAFVGRLVERLPCERVRLPHAVIAPTYVPGVLTVPVQDARRMGTDLPLARLYVYELLPETGTTREHELRIDRPEFDAGLRSWWDDIRAWGKRIAWREYEVRFGGHFRS